MSIFSFFFCVKFCICAMLSNIISIKRKWELSGKNNKKREMKSNRVTSLEKYFISLQCQEKSVFYIIFLNKKIINNHHRYDSTYEKVHRNLILHASITIDINLLHKRNIRKTYDCQRYCNFYN